MLSRYIERKLKTILKEWDVRSALTAFLESHKRKPKTEPRKIEKALARLSMKAMRAVVRAACVERANGYCECGCGIRFGSGEFTAEWDEFYGRRHVTIPETWMLVRCHHRNKTENNPSRANWDLTFRAHCLRHNYAFRPRLIKTPVTKVSEDGALAPKASGGTP